MKIGYVYVFILVVVVSMLFFANQSNAVIGSCAEPAIKYFPAAEAEQIFGPLTMMGPKAPGENNTCAFYFYTDPADMAWKAITTEIDQTSSTNNAKNLYESKKPLSGLSNFQQTNINNLGDEAFLLTATGTGGQAATYGVFARKGNFVLMDTGFARFTTPDKLEEFIRFAISQISGSNATPTSSTTPIAGGKFQNVTPTGFGTLVAASVITLILEILIPIIIIGLIIWLIRRARKNRAANLPPSAPVPPAAPPPPTNPPTSPPEETNTYENQNPPQQ